MAMDKNRLAIAMQTKVDDALAVLNLGTFNASDAKSAFYTGIAEAVIEEFQNYAEIRNIAVQVDSASGIGQTEEASGVLL